MNFRFDYICVHHIKVQLYLFFFFTSADVVKLCCDAKADFLDVNTLGSLITTWKHFIEDLCTKLMG